MRSSISNFGGNVRLEPAKLHQPANERELLEILGDMNGRRIRVMGRLHSWSEIVLSTDELLDLRRLDTLQIVEENGERFARVGAGTQVKRIVSELRRLGGWTLPSIGLIDEQSIAGAIATGTHGSGKHSLSHYVRGIRLAQLDDQGRTVVRTIDSGPALQGARCSLGCLGVVISVDLEIRKQYLIEEHFENHDDLASALSREPDYPLQQFYLIPWKWNFIGQHRVEVTGEKISKRFSRLFQLYFAVIFDVAMHLLILAATRLFRSPSIVKFLFGRAIPLFVIHNWRVVDRSDRILTMRHDLFRHIEIEMFVRRSELDGMMQFVKWLVRVASGEKAELPAELRERWSGVELQKELESLRGRYTHHYPICVRRVLPDDTLISMTAGWDEPGYAVSLICYFPPDAREAFVDFARLLTRSSIRMFGARAHWGKFNDIGESELLANVDGWKQFSEQVRNADPQGVFQNEWTRRLLETGRSPDRGSGG